MDEINEVNCLPGIVTVIQARMRSACLPGAPLLPLGNATVLEQVIHRVRAAKLNGSIIVAVPQGESSPVLEYICQSQDVTCVVGDSSDMLDCTLHIARQYEARIVACCQAHNPLLEPRMLWASAQYALNSGMDITTVARLPLGIAGEAMPVRTLERIARLSRQPEHREHISNFVEAHPYLFDHAQLPPPTRLARPDLRLTLETEADYWFLKRLYAEVLPNKDGLLSVDDCIAHIDGNLALSLHSHDDFCIVGAAA